MKYGGRNNRVEHLSRLKNELYIRQARVVPGKHVIVTLMLSLKKAKVKAEAIPVYMYQGQTATKQPKDKGEKPLNWCTQDISTKLKHYISPHRKIGFRPQQGILTLGT